MIGLAVLTTDGRRDCIRRTIDSAWASLTGPIIQRVIFTDDDPSYVEWLNGQFPGWEIVTTGPKSGYAAAMAAEWEVLRRSGMDAWLMMEDDFTFNRPIDLQAMRAVLMANQNVAQLALRRQPWNDAERAAGGIVEQHPDWYEDAELDDGSGGRWPVLLHGGYFTNNPSLVQPWVFDVAYPTGPDAEGRFSFELKAARPDVRFAYWGARTESPQVHHIGDVQARGAF